MKLDARTAVILPVPDRLAVPHNLFLHHVQCYYGNQSILNAALLLRQRQSSRPAKHVFQILDCYLTMHNWSVAPGCAGQVWLYKYSPHSRTHEDAHVQCTRVWHSALLTPRGLNSRISNIYSCQLFLVIYSIHLPVWPAVQHNDCNI